jgi:small subunit ribosomal protein S7
MIQNRLDKEKPETLPKTAIELFQKALENVRPSVEVRSKRVGGANYQVPMQLNKRRAQSLTFRWIIESVREEKGKPVALRLAKELYDAAKGEGKAVTTRENTHRMADANKAFAHFAW